MVTITKRQATAGNFLPSNFIKDAFKKAFLWKKNSFIRILRQNSNIFTIENLYFSEQNPKFLCEKQFSRKTPISYASTAELPSFQISNISTFYRKKLLFKKYYFYSHSSVNLLQFGYKNFQTQPCNWQV